jgi:NADPH-dependent 7-cyano-7-deazaguanine reductase QueF-like protein
MPEVTEVVLDVLRNRLRLNVKPRTDGEDRWYVIELAFVNDDGSYEVLDSDMLPGS